jgi:hypothetical protein
MPRFRCIKCARPPRGREFGRDDLVPVCDQCGAMGSPWVFELTDVHLVALDPKGPLEGAMGRQLVACQPSREYLALHAHDDFAATDDPRVVTCPRCKGTDAYKQRASLYKSLRRERDMEAYARKVRVDLGNLKR